MSSETFVARLLKLAIIIMSMNMICVHADNWAVLIAGSRYFFNYRHQSDICHAYQILTRKGGIPADNIIVMMYDDIANNSQNPFPGELFNRPNGTNVYDGVVIDYRGEHVNKETFLKVLAGDKSVGGKVIESTDEDDVFIYYADHGATGLVAMPSGDVLYADELMNALKSMYVRKMYRQMVIYVEACESGSMFDGLLPANMSIFATTAANSDESSYAYYYWAPVGTYLGDEYSIRWMEDSDANWKKKESLEVQFDHVKELVKESHPQKFGTMAWVNEPISDFEGDDTPSHAVQSKNTNKLLQRSVGERREASSVSSRDVKLFYLMQKYALASSPVMKLDYARKVDEEIGYRHSVDLKIRMVVKNMLSRSGMGVSVDEFMSLSHSPRHFDCLRSVKGEFEARCEKLVEYGLKHVKNLVQLCETFSVRHILQAIKLVCF